MAIVAAPANEFEYVRQLAMPILAPLGIFGMVLIFSVFLLVEQNANLALEISHFGYVLETGRVVVQGDSASLRQNPQVKSAYLGG